MSAPVPAVAALLADLAARGVELAVEGGRLRYRPRAAVTGLLAERLKEHKADLLHLLRSGQGCSIAELAVLAGAGLAPADVPGLAQVKAAFADLGATVVGFEPRAGALSAEDIPEEWRDTYEERAAVREFEGEMPRWRAEPLALRDTERLMVQIRPSDTPMGTAGAGSLSLASPDMPASVVGAAFPLAPGMSPGRKERAWRA